MRLSELADRLNEGHRASLTNRDIAQAEGDSDRARQAANAASRCGAKESALRAYVAAFGDRRAMPHEIGE